jgi:hypothetical protein
MHSSREFSASYRGWSGGEIRVSFAHAGENAMNYTTDFKSVRGAVSAAEWQARCDLAACYRLMDAYGMSDLIYNHITARVPGT